MSSQPPNPIENVGNIFQKGLGMINGGVGQVANVISSADSSLKTLDGSLTGRAAPAPAAPAAAAAPSGGSDMSGQVVALVSQAQQAFQQTGNLSSPQVTQPFQQLMSMLMQPSLAGLPGPDALSGLMPTASTALQDLRGSMALFRLANGTGTPDDFLAVLNFAQQLQGRVQSATQTAQTTTAAAPAAAAASASTQAEPKKTRRRRSRSKKSTAVNPNAPDEANQALATGVAEELKDASLKKAAREYNAGKLSEDGFQEKFGEVAEKKGRDVDEVLDKAVERMNAAAAK